jgi:hypothetical protein
MMPALGLGDSSLINVKKVKTGKAMPVTGREGP